jgi:hypothetical protein
VWVEGHRLDRAKAALQTFDRVGLLGLVQDLYAASDHNQSFLHARLGLGHDQLRPYKGNISMWICPDPMRNQRASVLNAKKAIADYKRAMGRPDGLVELSIFYCEEAFSFLESYGVETRSCSLRGDRGQRRGYRLRRQHHGDPGGSANGTPGSARNADMSEAWGAHGSLCRRAGARGAANGGLAPSAASFEAGYARAGPEPHKARRPRLTRKLANECRKSWSRTSGNPRMASGAAPIGAMYDRPVRANRRCILSLAPVSPWLRCRQLEQLDGSSVEADSSGLAAYHDGHQQRVALPIDVLPLGLSNLSCGERQSAGAA